MRHISLIFMLTAFMVSCGDERISKDIPGLGSASLQAQQDLLSGHWCNQLDGSETMTISGNNSFQTDVCGVIGTYEIKAGGKFTMQVTSSSGAENCAPIGTHECAYELKNDNNVLDLQCVVQSKSYVTTFHRGSCN